MNSLGIIIWVATISLCAVYFFIAIKQKKEAELSFLIMQSVGEKYPFSCYSLHILQTLWVLEISWVMQEVHILTVCPGLLLS